jgi:DNA-binding PadR family transcriptional regulator
MHDTIDSYIGFAIPYIEADTGRERSPMTPSIEPLGYQRVLVLSALAAGAHYGLEVIERTGLSSGTVYPALRRLEAGGLLESDWEDEARAHDDGRPARRYYRLTREGSAALAVARDRLRAQQRALGLAEEGAGGG